MSDTIAAISTIQAPSAIGILRLTGPDTRAVLDQVFRPFHGGAASAQPSRKMIYGAVLDARGQVIDHALAVWFQGPHSYTGEDSAEIHCHGSPVVLQEGLQALFAAGARQAGRGEFTKRSFLNGQMDLSQAEAVIDLIEAETPEAARNAVGQIDGVLRRQIEPIYESLMALASRFYAVVDYPDEEIGEVQEQEWQQRLTDAQQKLKALLSTFERGRVLRSGIPTAIVGRPNVGKSSLLNALLGYDRAIVTEIPGTTRDTVEEKARVGGVLLRLIDTAGLRSTRDTVEKIGVERSRQAAEQAELVLVLLDGSEGLQEEDRAVLALAGDCRRWILIWTKSDLTGMTPPPALSLAENSTPPQAILSLSSRTGEGIDRLEQTVEALFSAPSACAGSLLTNARQAEAVARAEQGIARALAAHEVGLTPDAVLMDAEDAMNALGEILGKNIREDLVETIFSRFCVGK